MSPAIIIGLLALVNLAGLAMHLVLLSRIRMLIQQQREHLRTEREAIEGDMVRALQTRMRASKAFDPSVDVLRNPRSA